MPEGLLESVDELSHKQGVSRSALIREACARYVSSTQEEEWDRLSDEGYARVPEDEEGGWRDKLAADVMAKDEW